VTVKINAKLPDEPDDGLEAYEDQILRRPKQPLCAIVMLSCDTVEQKIRTGVRNPKMDITAIEILTDRDALLGADMLDLAKSNRTGQQTLRPHRDAALLRKSEYSFGLQTGEPDPIGEDSEPDAWTVTGLDRVSDES
jgi:hypothetical protein